MSERADTHIFSAYKPQQAEASHHKEGGREELDVHICELSLYSQYQLPAHERGNFIFRSNMNDERCQVVSSGHKGPEIQRCEHDPVIKSY